MYKRGRTRAQAPSVCTWVCITVTPVVGGCLEVMGGESWGDIPWLGADGGTPRLGVDGGIPHLAPPLRWHPVSKQHPR